MLTREPTATPEQVMGTSLRLEIEAAALYQRFQAATSDPELVELWQTMSRAETYHARLIADLASEREFSVPIVPVSVLTAIVDRAEAIRREADEGPLTTERMLSITAALEFSEMDDLFTAICRSAGVSPDGARADHLEPLVQAVLLRQSGDAILGHLLAALIRLERRADSVATPGLPPAMAASSR